MTDFTERPPLDIDTAPPADAGHGALTDLVPDGVFGGSLADFLFPEPAPRSTGGIVKWWEKRRLPYNLIVGSAGLFSTAFLAILSSIPPGSPDGGTILVPLEAILVVGIGANVMYFLGSIVESLSLKIFGRGLLPIGPALYRMGLTFSVGLMLLPTVIWTVLWVITALGLDV